MNKLIITCILCVLFFELQASPIKKEKSVHYEQNSIQQGDQTIIITYLQNFTYKLHESASWSIISQKDQKTVATGVGTIKEYKFTEPGSYLIQLFDNSVHNPNECNHIHTSSRIIIEVSEMEMLFDFNTIHFSQELIGGQELQNIEMSIEVDFKHFYNQTVEFSNLVHSAGVDANIIGCIAEKQILVPGKNKIVYQLKGSASKDTYIMFDFIDVNGQIQTYYHTTKLN